MEMPQVTPGHRRLEIMTGSWVGEETMVPSSWDPKGSRAIGRVKAYVALDGFAVVMDYEQEKAGQVTFRGHGVVTFDAAADEVVMHWFDSIGGPREEFRGRFDGDRLTLTSHNPLGHARLSYDYTGRGLTSRMEMSQDGANWSVLFDGSYRRE